MNLNETETGGDESPVVFVESDHSISLRKKSDCFPSIGFRMPQEPPSSSNGWWCSMDSEYAFVGFSYEVSQCEPGIP